MKNLQEKPPAWLWDELHKMFDIEDDKTIYSWGDIIYNPGNIVLDPYLIAHEATHTRQHEAYGGPEQWWRRYLADKQFRLEQEIEAYHNQYAHFCILNHDRNRQVKYLQMLAYCLTHPMYGLTIPRALAMAEIKNPSTTPPLLG